MLTNIATKLLILKPHSLRKGHLSTSSHAFRDYVVELRSDTFTTPNDVLKRAMVEADTGDDIYGESSSVNSETIPK